MAENGVACKHLLQYFEQGFTVCLQFKKRWINCFEMKLQEMLLTSLSGSMPINWPNTLFFYWFCLKYLSQKLAIHCRNITSTLVQAFFKIYIAKCAFHSQRWPFTWMKQKSKYSSCHCTERKNRSSQLKPQTWFFLFQNILTVSYKN